MEYTKLKNINKFISQSVNPTKSPDMLFELYSVPIYETGHPEYLKGREIASSKVVVCKNDILLCKINPRINRVWVVADESEYPSIASSEWIVVRTNEYDPEFLAWYFRSPKFKNLMVSEVTGIGGSLTRAQPKAVAEYPVPVLEKDEQKSIAWLFNNVDVVIKIRQKQLRKLDELIKARFVEMFGDLDSNPMGWEIKKFEDITEFITDGEHATPRRTDRGIYLLSARNVLNHRLQLEDVDYIDNDEYERISKRISPREGDVLLSCSGTVGRCCCVPEDLKFQMVRSIAILRFKKAINPVFAEYMITSDYIQKQIDKAKTASSQANLFQGKIAKINGFVPPIELQNDFLKFVHQVNKSKVVAYNSVTKNNKMWRTGRQLVWN